MIGGVLGGVADAAEGEGDTFGSRLGKGLLVGFGALLSGPGLQGIIALGMGLVRNLVSFAGQALSDLSGANQSAQDFKGIQEAITGQLQQNPQLLRSILDGSVSIESAHQKILQRISDENALYREQEKIATNIAAKLVTSGVTLAKPTDEKLEAIIPHVSPQLKLKKSQNGKSVPYISRMI